MDPLRDASDSTDRSDAARRHERLSVLFAEARRRPAAERLTWLSTECSDDPELLTDLRSLLAIDDAGTPLDEGLLSAPHSVATLLEPETPSIDGYTIGTKLGEGGMGTVYQAEQDHPRRRVAIKVLHAGDGERARRFEREADVLARLHHPGIAPIYAAGFTRSTSHAPSRPFIAMELVDGIAVDAFVRDCAPSTRDVVRMMVRVCDAVHHAHVNGVVHRDLKPSNILVDAHGRPRVLDFGVARVLLDDGDRSVHTKDGQFVGTLRWMSPEQIGAVGGEVGPRSDVYALGLLLHALLGGAPIFPDAHLPLAEAVRVIRDVEPLPLGRVDPRLRGDLESIVGVALRKEPAERYADAGALGRDLERWLDGEAVSARPLGGVERLRRFAAQNRLVVAATLTAVVALGAGLTATSLSLLQVRTERDNAQRETRNARAALDFVTLLLRGADPAEQDPHGGLSGMPAPIPSVRELLDQATAALPSTVDGQPKLEVELRLILGETYTHFGLYDEAEGHFRTALALIDATEDIDPAIATGVTTSLASLYAMTNRVDDLAPLVERIHASERTTTQDALRLMAMGILLQEADRGPEAITTFERALELALSAEANGAAPSTMPWLIRSNLVNVLVGEGHFDRAEPLIEEVLRTDPKSSPRNTMNVRNSLGWMRMKQGRAAEAIEIYRSLMTDIGPTLPPIDRMRAATTVNLARALREAGRLDEAEPLARDALAQMITLFGESAARTASARRLVNDIVAKRGGSSTTP